MRFLIICRYINIYLNIVLVGVCFWVQVAMSVDDGFRPTAAEIKSCENALGLLDKVEIGLSILEQAKNMIVR